MLMSLVHDELRTIAAQQMRGQQPGHTLQPTALVNEAYLKLVGKADRNWNNRQHFLAAAATTRGIVDDEFLALVVLSAVITNLMTMTEATTTTTTGTP